MRNRELRQAARAAGLRHFIARCPRHGEARHYTSSGRCMQCAAAANDPARQAEYWATVAPEINRKRRERYAAAKAQAA